MPVGGNGQAEAQVGGVAVSPTQWLGVAVFLGLAILASTQFGAIWRGDQRPQWPDWFARSVPACIVCGWLMLAALPIALYAMSRPEPVSPWLVWLVAVALLAVVGAFLVAAAVALTGYPRWAVPPYLRRGDERR
jgi:hypothetical protein